MSFYFENGIIDYLKNSTRGGFIMKRFLIAVAMAAATVTTPALAADVGVSISIGQPGFYGRLDIGDFPTPQLIYPQPVIISQGVVAGPPIYLHVPPGHAKNWSKHCGEYNACGQRVYFVHGDWYEREYVPRYQKKHGGGKPQKGGKGQGQGQGQGRGR
jgi:hypothetical protein